MFYSERIWLAYLEWIDSGKRVETLHIYAKRYDVGEEDIWEQHLIFYD